MTVPGEVASPGVKRKRKRKRAKVDTGEQGNAVRKPFTQPKVLKDDDPKHEADNSTIGYAIIGIGTFLGILFLSNKA